jgi:hypothetical protein
MTLAGESLEYTGRAYTDDGNLFYVEKHKEEYESNSILKSSTNYDHPAGKTLAQLTTEHRPLLTVPKHHFVDKRSGYEHGLVITKNIFQCFKREESGKERESFNCQPNGNSFSSKGLHFYLQQNLTNFNDDLDETIDFILPGKMDRFKFKLYVKKRTKDDITFELKIKSWILRAFAPKMTLKYSLKTKKLLEYKGPSNILNKDGDVKQVRIIYDYPKAYALSH